MQVFCLVLFVSGVVLTSQADFNNGHVTDNDIIDLDGDLWGENLSSGPAPVAPSSTTIIEQEAPGGGDYDPTSDGDDDTDNFSGSGSGELELSGTEAGNVTVNRTDAAPTGESDTNVVDEISNVIQISPQGMPVEPDMTDEIQLEEETNRISADWTEETVLQRKVPKYHCEFSLYDLKHQEFVHENWNYSKLLKKADVVLWCRNSDRFILFHSPQKTCRSKMDLFCRAGSEPELKKKKMKHKGDFGNRCWSRFTFGGTMPQGFLDNNKELYYICQRFSPHGAFGKAFSSSDSYFGTLLDRQRRLPIMALAKVTALGDSVWPVVPDMVENSLIKHKTSRWIFNWFSEQKKKGMLLPTEVDDCDDEDDCRYDEYQPITADYTNSHYKKAYLIWPTLVGRRADQRIATLTLTNTAMMHPALFPLWQGVIMGVRDYAEKRCGIPTSPKPQKKSYKSRSALYVIAGTVPSTNRTRVLWNEVNAPETFWMTGCCVQDAKIESFGIYAHNGPNSPVIATSVSELQEILADKFGLNQTENPIKLYPAQAGVCDDVGHDVSSTIL